MYLKECALGHSPRHVVKHDDVLCICPACEAKYLWTGTTWIQYSASAIIDDERQFKIFLEKRKEDFVSELTNYASNQFNNASNRISDAMNFMGKEIGSGIRDAANIQAGAHLFTEILRSLREEELQKRQHAHERDLFDRRIRHEKEIIIESRLLEYFKLAFSSFSRETRQKMIEGAFRVAEYERSVITYKNLVFNSLNNNEGLNRIQNEINSLNESQGYVDKCIFPDKEIESLEIKRDKLLGEKIEEDKKPRISKLFYHSYFSEVFSAASLIISLIILFLIWGNPVFRELSKPWKAEWTHWWLPFRLFVGFFMLIGYGCLIAAAGAIIYGLWHVLFYISGFIGASFSSPSFNPSIKKNNLIEEQLKEIRKEIKEIKNKLKNAEKTKLNEVLQKAKSRCDYFYNQLLKRANEQIEKHNSEMILWRDEVLSHLPDYIRSLCYKLSDLFRT